MARPPKYDWPMWFKVYLNSRFSAIKHFYDWISTEKSFGGETIPSWDRIQKVATKDKWRKKKKGMINKQVEAAFAKGVERYVEKDENVKKAVEERKKQEVLKTGLTQAAVAIANAVAKKMQDAEEWKIADLNMNIGEIINHAARFLGMETRESQTAGVIVNPEGGMVNTRAIISGLTDAEIRARLDSAGTKEITVDAEVLDLSDIEEDGNE